MNFSIIPHKGSAILWSERSRKVSNTSCCERENAL